MSQDFNAFVRDRLKSIRLSQRAVEAVIGRDYALRVVLKGDSLPPLHELHKWAEALQLDRAGRRELYLLADQAHGGGTIIAWLIQELDSYEKRVDLVERGNGRVLTENEELRTKIAEITNENAEMRKKLDPVNMPTRDIK